MVTKYEPTEEQLKWLNFVYDRKKDMEEGRVGGSGKVDNWEEYWDDSDKAYYAYTESKDSDDWRSNLHIPIEFSIVETIKQESMEQQVTFRGEPRSSDDTQKVPFVNETIDFALDKMDWDVTRYMLDHERFIRGTAVGKVIYRKEPREIKEMTEYNPETDEEKYEEKTIFDYDDVFIQYRDLWLMYFDDMARTMADARDCIEREIMHIDEFHRLYDKRYPDAKKVKKGGDTEILSNYELPKDVNNEDVEVLHYWNKPNDQYFIVANYVLVRNAPNPYSHKQLPYAILHGVRTNDSIYGLGIPGAVKQLVDELNTLRNLRIDFQHMSIDKMFIISDQMDLDEEDLVVRPHGMIPVSTTTMPIQNYIQPIEYGDIKPSSVEDINMLFDDIRRTVGVDDRVQGVMPPGRGTATEAAILKEATLKRISMMAKLAQSDGLKRIGRLLLDTISQYYTLPRVKKIVGEDGKETEMETYREIRTPKEVVPTQSGMPELRTGKGEQFSFFEASPEMIRADLDVKVKAYTVPFVSRALQQAKLNEMVDRITMNPLWQKFQDARKSFERYLTINDERSEDWMNEDMPSQEDEQAMAQQENSQLDNGELVPPTQNISENHTAVHLERTQNTDFEMLPPEAQDAYDQHIMGEQQQHQGGEVKPSMGSRPAMAGPPAPNMGAEGANNQMGVV